MWQSVMKVCYKFPRHESVLRMYVAFCSVFQATFFETGDSSEGYVQLAGTGSWVVARRNETTFMERLPAFPEVDKTPRRFKVAASQGVETIVGPSSSAQRTGQVLIAGTEGRSEMVWSIKGWPSDRGMGDKKFVLLEGMGWVELSAGRGESQLEEVNVIPETPPNGVQENGS